LPGEHKCGEARDHRERDLLQLRHSTSFTLRHDQQRNSRER
jgi:hypothetical protein